MSGSFTPFFVADRPASLKLLSGVTIPPGKQIGVMTHANISPQFIQLFSKFPCIDQESCEVIGGLKCPHGGDVTKCVFGKCWKNRMIRICDSGVFQKNGNQKDDYYSLFQKYESLQTDFGIIIDYLSDKDKTLKSAELALDEYKRRNYKFELIGVAQGLSEDDYIDSYSALRRMGFSHIAVGGMLKKRNNTRFVSVNSEELMKNVLISIREIDPDGWLFALGCYSPKRHSTFLEYSIFGADYKGWIFRYDGSSPKRGHQRSRDSRFRQVRNHIQDEVLIRSQEWRPGPRLLVISCSKKKKQSKMMNAINLYDSSMYQMIRKYMYDFSNSDGLDIAIISAKHGLIEPHDRIGYYDQKMDSMRARELSGQILERITEMNDRKEYSEVFVNVGKSYLDALEPALSTFPEEVKVTIAEGRLGEKLSKTKQWILS